MTPIGGRQIRSASQYGQGDSMKSHPSMKNAKQEDDQIYYINADQYQPPTDEQNRSLNDVTTTMNKAYGSQSKSSRRSSMMDYEDRDGSQANCNKMTRAALIVFCLILTVISLILIGIGIFAPYWLTLDVTEYGQEWVIGLWMYCRRGGNRNEVGGLGIDLRQWICDLKTTFDTKTGFQEQAAFVQSDHNEVAVLIFLCISFMFGCCTLFSLCCAYCNKHVPYCLVMTNLASMITALVGVLMFVVSMQDVQARRFTSFNSVYLATWGYALYCALFGAAIQILNFVVSLPLVLLSFAYNKNKQEEKMYGGGGGGSNFDMGAYNAGSTYNTAVTSSMRKPMPQTFDTLDEQPDMSQGVYVVERDPDTKSIVSVKHFHDDQELQDAMRAPSSASIMKKQPQPRGDVLDMLNQSQSQSIYGQNGQGYGGQNSVNYGGQGVQNSGNYGGQPLVNYTPSQPTIQSSLNANRPVYMTGSTNFNNMNTAPHTPAMMHGGIGGGINYADQSMNRPSWQADNMSRAESRI